MSIQSNKNNTHYFLKWIKNFGIDYILSPIQSQDTKDCDALSSTKAYANSQQHYGYKIKFTSIDDLKQAVMNLYHPLKDGARNVVFSSGPTNAQLMLIGEAPGAEEDAQGLPFVGESGRLVNNILKAVNISRDDVYVTNVVFWRPPNNRPPLPEEIEFCRPYFSEHIRLINPKVVVLLGAVATRAILHVSKGITSLRGVKQFVNDVCCIPTFHPSYLLRSPSKKYEAMMDFNLACNILRG